MHDKHPRVNGERQRLCAVQRCASKRTACRSGAQRQHQLGAGMRENGDEACNEMGGWKGQGLGRGARPAAERCCWRSCHHCHEVR
jgi:hypothetical protein